MNNQELTFIKLRDKYKIKLNNSGETFNYELNERLSFALRDAILKLNPSIKERFNHIFNSTFTHHLKNEILVKNKLISDFSHYKLVEYLDFSTEEKKGTLEKVFDSYLEIYVRFVIRNLKKTKYHSKILETLGQSNINAIISIMLDSAQEKYALTRTQDEIAFQNERYEIKSIRNTLLANYKISQILFGEPFFQFFLIALSKMIIVNETKTSEKRHKTYVFELSVQIQSNKRIISELNKLALNEMVINPYLKESPDWEMLYNQNQYTNNTGGHYLQETHKRDTLQANKFNSEHTSYLYDINSAAFSINQIQNQIYIINLEWFNAYYSYLNPYLVTTLQLQDAELKLKKEKKRSKEKL